MIWKGSTNHESLACGFVCASRKDIDDIYRYIAFTLGEPNAAWKQTERIREVVDKLDRMPERFPVIGEEPWKSREARRVNIDNYAVIYIADDVSDTVTVIRVLYARRDFLRFVDPI